MISRITRDLLSRCIAPKLSKEVIATSRLLSNRMPATGTSSSNCGLGFHQLGHPRAPNKSILQAHESKVLAELLAYHGGEIKYFLGKSLPGSNEVGGRREKEEGPGRFSSSYSVLA